MYRVCSSYLLPSGLTSRGGVKSSSVSSSAAERVLPLGSSCSSLTIEDDGEIYDSPLVSLLTGLLNDNLTTLDKFGKCQTDDKTRSKIAKQKRMNRYLSKLQDPAREFMIYKTATAPKRDVCGQVRFIAACPDSQTTLDHTVLPVHQSCGRISCSCPSCSNKAISRRVKDGHLRVEAFQHLYQEQNPGASRLKVSHTILSFPKNKFTKKQISQDGLGPIWDSNKKFLLKHNVHPSAGCISVLHLTRLVHEDGSTCLNHKECDLEHFDTWGPHIHNLGFIYVQDSKKIEYEEKLLFRKLPDLYGERSFVKTLRYELGHATISTKTTTGRSQETIRHYGTLSKRSLRKSKVGDEPSNIKCDKCQQDLQQFLPVRVGVDGDLSTDTPNYSKLWADNISVHHPILRFRHKLFPDASWIVHTSELLLEFKRGAADD